MPKPFFTLRTELFLRVTVLPVFRAVCNNAIRIAWHCQLHIVKHKPSVVHITSVRRADQDSSVRTFIVTTTLPFFTVSVTLGVIYIYCRVASRIGVCVTVLDSGFRFSDRKLFGQSLHNRAVM